MEDESEDKEGKNGHEHVQSCQAYMVHVFIRIALHLFSFHLGVFFGFYLLFPKHLVSASLPACRGPPCKRRVTPRRNCTHL